MSDCPWTIRGQRGSTPAPAPQGAMTKLNLTGLGLKSNLLPPFPSPQSQGQSLSSPECQEALSLGVSSPTADRPLLLPPRSASRVFWR